jgi:hypothetical protein
MLSVLCTTQQQRQQQQQRRQRLIVQLTYLLVKVYLSSRCSAAQRMTADPASHS